MTGSQTSQHLLQFPVVPLRDMVVYPEGVQPLFVGTKKSIRALEHAQHQGTENQVLLVAKREAEKEVLEPGDLFEIGTVAKVLQMVSMTDETVKILVEGDFCAQIQSLQGGDFLQAEVAPVQEEEFDPDDLEEQLRFVVAQFEEYAKLSKKAPEEAVSSIKKMSRAGLVADTIAAQLTLKLAEKQTLLETRRVADRLKQLASLLVREIDFFQTSKRIHGQVKKQVEKSQREYFLAEQMKAIQKELGADDGAPGELEEMRKRLEQAGMSREARQKVDAEISKLKMMSPMSAEATVVRSYVDWMLKLPWNKRSRIRYDLDRAQQALEADHYGLENVKERILEHLAVQRRVRRLRGPVLCLVGPPGVGKTSLGESIARATNRKFVRMALGGLRDEAEIRGHRRTYIGSMPGRVMQKLVKAGTRNPLFLFDEVDKMGQDYRGDPASALLEVLDPEQNHTFNDHYLEVDFDLSEVMYVCTANSMDIPSPLLDRMEVIRIPGYMEDEKVDIASRYLLPKQMKQNGVKRNELAVSEDTIRDLSRYYTREAGVRGLERELAGICRKVVKRKALSPSDERMDIQPGDLEDFVGIRKFTFGRVEEQNQIGQVTGLAVTRTGGELLSIEVAVVPGKGRHIRTGSLGNVMQESIQAAMTVVRSRADALGIAHDFHEKFDTHIHIPEGAIPKDGPSAGVALCTALVSALTAIPARCDTAMTGEITLRGQVLPVGGIREKLLMAHGGGIRQVIIPEQNRRDLKEVPDNIKADLEIHVVGRIDEVLELALVEKPESGSAGRDGVADQPPGKESRISAH